MREAPTLCILGAGSNIGAHVARKFASKGYRIALVSRTKEKKALIEGQLHVQSDLYDPSSVAGAFAEIRQSLGVPSVVVYNGEDPFRTKRKGEGSSDAELTLEKLQQTRQTTEATQ